MNIPATLKALLVYPETEGPPPSPYPESDGLPMADNSRQMRWIVFLYCNLIWLFRGRDDVAVHGNMFWYVEEADAKQRQAPDVFVVFGRPPGERTSYQQWREDNVPVTVAFEVLSPSMTAEDYQEKEEFYDRHGVEEYYEYNPATNRLTGFHRHGEVWLRIRRFDQWVSPRLGVRFIINGEELAIETTDGQRFFSFEEAAQRWQDALRRADEEKHRADEEKRRALRLVELGRKVRRGQASPRELEELELLERQVTD